MNETAQFVIRHGYALLFFWILAEQGALPLPSVPLLLVCGALAKVGYLRPAFVLFWGIAACLIADSVWFQIGRKRGPRILALLCRLALEPDSCIRQTESGFHKFGLRFLLISELPARGPENAFIPGMNFGVRWSRFLLYDTAGSAVWISSWGLVGYLFGEQLEAVGAVVARAGFRLFLSIVVILGGWILWKHILRLLFLRKVAAARITPEELMALLEAGEEMLVIDVRATSPGEDALPGSLRIPSADLAKRHGEIARYRDVILFCS